VGSDAVVICRSTHAIALSVSGLGAIRLLFPDVISR
jgi:hypothetical protein